MNVLHLVPALEGGGVETGTIDLALSLKKLGQKVIVVSNGGRMVKVLEDSGILHIKIPVHKKSPFAPLLAFRIASIIRTHGIDIVHASSRVPAWIGFLACKLTKTAFVTSCHGFYARHFFSLVMGWGELIIVISKSIEKRIVEDFKVPKKKIRLVYRGVDLTKFPYCPDKYDEKKDSFLVTNIGRLTPIKGQYEFIKAMRHVIDRMPNVEAWIVGGYSPRREHYLDGLTNLLKELGIGKHIKFLGLRSDVRELLKRSDCLVLSTNVPEGFGRTLVEAGAIGTACCASNVGGIREIIDDGVSGLLFPPRDELKMAETIVTMLSDVDLRKKCARNLRKKVEEFFTLERMAETTLSVYEEVVKSRRQR